MFQRLFISTLLISTFSFGAIKWELDKSHSEVGFEIKHLMVSIVKGRFDKFEASFELDEATGKVSNILAVIDVKSINTNEKKRDEHLRGPDFFDAKKFPTMTFKSASGELKKDSEVEIPGTLSMKGV